jgi:hypothetical protein
MRLIDGISKEVEMNTLFFLICSVGLVRSWVTIITAHPT